MPGYKQVKLSGLNRLRTYEQKLKQSQERYRRPPLSTLTDASSLRSSLELISAEIDSLLRQTTCTSYTDDKISQINVHIRQLRREYIACRNKLEKMECKSNRAARTNPHSSHPDDVKRVALAVDSPSAMMNLPLTRNLPKSGQEDADSLVPYDLSDEN